MDETTTAEAFRKFLTMYHNSLFLLTLPFRITSTNLHCLIIKAPARNLEGQEDVLRMTQPLTCALIGLEPRLFFFVYEVQRQLESNMLHYSHRLEVEKKTPPLSSPSNFCSISLVPFKKLNSRCRTGSSQSILNVFVCFFSICIYTGLHLN